MIRGSLVLLFRGWLQAFAAIVCATLVGVAAPVTANAVSLGTALPADARAEASTSEMVAVIATPAPDDRRAAPPLFVARETPVDTDALLSRAALDGAVSSAAAAMRVYAPDTVYTLVEVNRGRRKAGAQSVNFASTADFGNGNGNGPEQQTALGCMTMAIAYEAGREPIAGMESVGQVILNRMRTARFPKTACGVVFQGSERRTGCQFTFTCDGSLRRSLLKDTLERSRAAALAVLTGAAADHVAGATHYHADYVLPRWARDGTRVAKIGAHIFYRMPGDGRASAVAEPFTDDDDMRIARGNFTASNSAPRGVFAPWGLPIAQVAH